MNDGTSPIESQTAFRDAGQAGCAGCNKPLCIRQTVINYAMGNEDALFCLVCLGQESDASPTQVLTGIRDYILGRDCFAKEWRKYTDESHCPCPSLCIPKVCFGESDG